MKVPPSPADAPMPPDTESPPSTPIRRLPLTPVGGLSWRLRDKQDKTTYSTAPGPRIKPLTVSPLIAARSRRFRLCGRRVLLWGLFWYVAFQIVPTIFKDRWMRIGPYYEQHKWPELGQLVAEDPARPLLVMVGSSRTAWDFQAGALDGMPDSDGRPMLVYNFGVPATGPCFQLFCLRDMLAKGIRPRFLLIELLPPLLCEPKRGILSEDSLLEYESLSAHRMLQWMPYLQRRKKWANLWIEARVAPVYFFRNHLIAEAMALITGEPVPKHAPIDNRGWHVALPGINPLVHESYLQAGREGYGPGLMKFHMGKTQYRVIHELLTLCRREKIPSALVMMPEDSRFRSWYSPEAKTAVRDLVAELKQTYGVEMIDAQCWLGDQDFEDGHHALLDGAQKFTRRMRAELPRLLAQSAVSDASQKRW